MTVLVTNDGFFSLDLPYRPEQFDSAHAWTCALRKQKCGSPVSPMFPGTYADPLPLPYPWTKQPTSLCRLIESDVRVWLHDEEE